MEIAILPDGSSVKRLAARIVQKQTRQKPASVLGLATGRTMDELYQCLVELHQKHGLDFSEVTTFNLDEYVGLPPEHPNSYRTYMQRQLFDHININIKRTHLLDGTAADLKSECIRYEQQIRECGGIDLQLLGIGVAGHIAFNEPLSSLQSRTRDKMLTADTIRQNRELFGGDESKVPKRALTMGIATILEARQILLLATGDQKAEVIAKALEGPVTTAIPASALQMHTNCKVLLDEAAAERLMHKEYCRHVFENDPDWTELKQ